MANKCYKVTSLGCDDVLRVGYYCLGSLSIAPGGYCGGGYFVGEGVTGSITDNSTRSGSFEIVSCSNCSGCCTDGVNPSQSYDCLNGGCIPKSTYSTPGVFASLAACQSGCATNSNCTGECVSTAELTALQQAASNLQSKFCG